MTASQFTIYVPPVTTTWILDDPCGTCGGCRLRARGQQMLAVVEHTLLEAARELDPRQMRSDLYYSRLAAIMRRRAEAHRTLVSDPVAVQCENQEVRAE